MDDNTEETSSSLAGLRILDFSWSVVGPTMTRNLAAFGAEVIKVEWPSHADPMRTTMYASDVEEMGLDNGAFFNNLNIGKRSITLDAKSERGREIVRQLVAEADVVAESFSSQVFRQWGIDYPALRSMNPSIIYISASGFGHSGPYERYGTWGPTAQAFNGLTGVSGLPGQPPAGWGWSYMDIMGGAMATVAVLAAIHHRENTGEGQHIDMSQVEAGLSLGGVSIVDFSANGRTPDRDSFPPGNHALDPLDQDEDVVLSYRGEVGVPYNCYPTLGGGQNDFCVISILSDTEWRSLRSVLGEPEWAVEAVLDTFEGRLQHQEELDRRLAEWTCHQDKYQLMEKLQSFGVRCGAVQSAEDRLEHDPQVEHRALFPRLDHPLLGTHRFEGIPIKMGATTPMLRPEWPALGKDNTYVFGDLLGMSDTEIEELDNSGVTWPIGMPRKSKIERALW